MPKRGQLFVITKAKDLAKYIITITEKSPKKFRFTLVTRLQNYSLDAIENLYLANMQRDSSARREYQEKAKVLFSMVGFYAEIACDSGCILNKQFEQISLQVATCLLYLGKWISSANKMVSAEQTQIDIGAI